MTPLVRALDDPTIAVVGCFGVRQQDVRPFRGAPLGGDVDAVEGYIPGVRVAPTTLSRGPLDERFTFYRNLDIWWSLVLRDEGEDGDAAARRAGCDEMPAIRAPRAPD